MKKQIAIEIISFLFILLFVYAALMKLLDVEKFVVQLSESPLLVAFAGWIAWIVPIVELLIASLLIIPSSRLIGLYAAFTLMVSFTSYITVILTYSQKIPCSCGGILENMRWTEHLIFNSVFVLLAAIGVFISTKKESDYNQPVTAKG